MDLHASMHADVNDINFSPLIVSCSLILCFLFSLLLFIFSGDENWYQGRSPYYAANAGFSLYGSRNALFGSFSGCSKASYINSFFTNNGADVLLEALGIQAAEEGLGYCQEFNGNYQNQQDGEDDNNNNNPVPQSSMMGCNANGEFAMALFSDEYCQGKYFVNVSNTMEGDNADAIRTYNQVMHNRLDCKKIWNGKEKETNNGFQSQAHEVLQQSTVCDIRINPTCPDPYGIKTRYATAFHLAVTGRSTFFDMVVRKPMWVVSNVALIIGTFLLCATYAVQHRTRILQTQAKEPNRTWLRAFCMVAYKDFRTSLKRARKARRAARAAKLLQRKRRRERRARRGSRSGQSASTAASRAHSYHSEARSSQLDDGPTFDSEADGSGGMYA